MSDTFYEFIKSQKVAASIFPSRDPLIQMRNCSLSEAFRAIDLHISKGASVGNTESLVSGSGAISGLSWEISL